MLNPEDIFEPTPAMNMLAAAMDSLDDADVDGLVLIVKLWLPGDDTPK